MLFCHISKTVSATLLFCGSCGGDNFDCMVDFDLHDMPLDELDIANRS